MLHCSDVLKKASKIIVWFFFFSKIFGSVTGAICTINLCFLSHLSSHRYLALSRCSLLKNIFASLRLCSHIVITYSFGWLDHMGSGDGSWMHFYWPIVTCQLCQKHVVSLNYQDSHKVYIWSSDDIFLWNYQTLDLSMNALHVHSAAVCMAIFSSVNCFIHQSQGALTEKSNVKEKKTHVCYSCSPF